MSVIQMLPLFLKKKNTAATCHSFETCLPVGNQSPVLHSPGPEVGDGNHVLLGEGEGDLEVVLEELQDLGPDIPRLHFKYEFRSNMEFNYEYVFLTIIHTALLYPYFFCFRSVPLKSVVFLTIAFNIQARSDLYNLLSSSVRPSVRNDSQLAQGQSLLGADALDLFQLSAYLET